MFILMPQKTALSVAAAKAYPKLMGQKEQHGSSCVKVRELNLKSHLDLGFGLAMHVDHEKEKRWLGLFSLSCNSLKGVGSVQWRAEADKEESLSGNSQN